MKYQSLLVGRQELIFVYLFEVFYLPSKYICLLRSMSFSVFEGRQSFVVWKRSSSFLKQQFPLLIFPTSTISDVRARRLGKIETGGLRLLLKKDNVLIIYQTSQSRGVTVIPIVGDADISERRTGALGLPATPFKPTTDRNGQSKDPRAIRGSFFNPAGRNSEKKNSTKNQPLRMGLRRGLTARFPAFRDVAIAIHAKWFSGGLSRRHFPKDCFSPNGFIAQTNPV